MFKFKSKSNSASTLNRLAAVSMLALVALPAWAGAKDYQVTGQVQAVDATTITVLKGKEKFEIARDATTKAPADVKVGDKVTVYYSMKASEIEAKAAKAPKTK